MNFLMAIQFKEQADRYAEVQRRTAGDRSESDEQETPATLAEAEAAAGFADVNQAYSGRLIRR